MATPKYTAPAFDIAPLAAGSEVSDPNPGPDPAARNLAQQAQMWRKRSKQVKRLRLLFPGLIIFIIVLIFGWIAVKSVISALNIYSPTGQDIRMINPRYVGQTDNGTPYHVTGLEATRHGNASPLIYLKAPILETKGGRGPVSHLEAINGKYDDDNKMFWVNGHVNYSGGASTMTLKTEQAMVDITRNIVTGDAPVDAFWDKGSIHGESFAIYDNGSRIVFHGKGDKQVTGVFKDK